MSSRTLSDRVHGVFTVSILLLIAPAPDVTLAQTPDPPPLVDAEALRSQFLGKWSMKNHRRNNTEERLGLSNATHCIGSDGHLRIRTFRSLTGMAVMARPDALSRSGSMTDVLHGSFETWEDLPRVTNIPNASGTGQYGLLEHDSGLWFTYKAYYAVNEIDHPTQGYADGTSVFGLYRVGGAGSDRVGGYLASCPADINGDYLAGFCGGPGLQDQSKGPSLYGITMDTTLPLGGQLPSTKLLDYPDSNPCSLWNELTHVRGCAWIETAEFRGVLFSVRQGTGKIWYGEATTAIDGVTYTDPCGGNKGYHSDSYEQQIWVYDPLELKKVANGKQLPHLPQPASVIPLTEYEVRDAKNQPVTMCLRDGRLTVLLANGYRARGQQYESQPLVLEFDFKTEETTSGAAGTNTDGATTDGAKLPSGEQFLE